MGDCVPKRTWRIWHGEKQDLSVLVCSVELRGFRLWRAPGCLEIHSEVVDMGVSKNRGTPKWMVYNGKPYWNGWFGGTTIFGNIHIFKICQSYRISTFIFDIIWLSCDYAWKWDRLSWIVMNAQTTLKLMLNIWGGYEGQMMSQRHLHLISLPQPP